MAVDYSGPRMASVRPHARSASRSERGITPGQNGCAARDSNPEPAVKSPLLCSILLLHLVSSCAATCRDLPDCTASHESGGRAVPAAAGPYRDIRANMEQTWGGRSLRRQTQSVIRPASVAASWARFPASGTALMTVTDRTLLALGRLVRRLARASR